MILDVGHWLMVLRLIATSPQKDALWIEHRQVVRPHCEQLKYNFHSHDELLKRFELCNFLRLIKVTSSGFTLVLAWEISWNFIREFLEKYFAGMVVRVEIKENLKLRVAVKPISTARES